ncbi:MAG TPA: hypothetical protein VGJ85_05990 [Candidatus Nanopelagicaceae bacterium]
MHKEFPTVGLIGDSALLRMFAAPATALGVDIERIESGREFAHCTVISVLGDHLSDSQVRTLEASGQAIRPSSSALEFARRWNSDHEVNGPADATVSFLVALSPHGQASAWAPTGIYHDGSVSMTITPAPTLSANQIGIAQYIALNLAKESGAVGVVEVEIVFAYGEPAARRISLGPTLNGVWSIEGARTSEFEQHLRAILDLPLGDPSQLAPIAVTATFSGEGNMYRPYLHLMARSPGLKIHQYRSGPGQIKGHVTAMGSDLLDLRECVTHAVEYMSGEIDE